MAHPHSPPPPPSQVCIYYQTLLQLMDELRLDVSEFAGGRMKHFFHVWEGLTSDGEILLLVKGVKLDFVDNAELPAVQPAQPGLNHKERKISWKENPLTL